MRTRRNYEERFWRFVKKGRRCWMWTGRKNEKDGAGRFDVSPTRPGVIASRVSWEIHKGEIPAGLHVLHSCDNRGCVNPKHLFLGTHQDNMADRDTKGRQARGIKHGRAKLTDAEVRQIRKLYKPYQPGSLAWDVANRFGISDQAVLDIAHRRSWKHLR